MSFRRPSHKRSMWPVSRLVGFLLTVFLLCSLQPLQAQDLQYYYNLALKNDADFKAAGFAHEASLQVKNQAWSALLPNIDGKYSYSKINQDVTSSDNIVYPEGERKYTTKDFTLSITQPVVNISSLIRLTQAQMEIQASGIEYEIARQDLISRVAEAYLNVLASLIATETVVAEKKAVQRLFTVTDKKFKYGFARKTDLYDAQARFALIESDYIEAVNFKDDAFEALKAICNEAVVDIAPLKEDIVMEKADPDDVDVWIANALENNLEIQLLKHQLEIARREIKMQWAGHLPTVDMVGQYKQENSTGDLLASGGGNDVESKDFFVQVNFPLFSGGYTNSKVKEARANLKRINETLQGKKRAIRKEARAAFLKVKSSIMRSNALLASLESQKLAVKAKQKGFESGLYNLIDVLDAERLRYIAERDYANARFEYIFNSLKLKQIIGTLSAEDIAQVNNFFDPTDQKRACRQ